MIWLLGFAVATLDISACVIGKRLPPAALQTPRIRRVRHFALWFGVILSLLQLFLLWPYSGKWWILGFPFPGAAFEFRGSFWIDYVSGFTLPLLLLNIPLSVFLPHAMVIFYVKAFCVQKAV